MTFSASDDQNKHPAPDSKSHASKAETSEDKGWLPNLTGLPTIGEIEKLSQHVDEVMKQDKDKTCRAINPRLRKMIFLHFAIYQHMVNQRSIYLNDEKIHHWAHVFAMLLKESSGDTTNMTSMTGHSYSTYQAKSDLSRWRKIAKLSKNGDIPLNYQTNFGLTQLSIDRLFVALKLALDPAYLEGTKITKLNTAIAIRRLIWFYQDFAQGRLTQSHDRIHHHEQGNPEYSTRFAFGISTALLLCGTHYMFYEGYHEKTSGVTNLADAMGSIAYCKLGNSKDGYGLNEANKKCFAQWVTLCPTLNFDIAMLTPLKYFATRDASPVCEATFKALRTQKPVEHKKISTPKKQHKPQKITHHQHTTLGSRVKKVLLLTADLLTQLLTPATRQSNSHHIQH
ncbi:MAG: hypothetical protein P1U61_06800 [Legionellaceae bacterium]|nr:hypothetical protein [Legionellaceae bacterium]